MLQIYNSLTRRKEEFAPLVEGRVRMYACGVTVYDYFHIGNARMMAVFDMVVRYMRSVGLDVTYVRNITDIDDKIINRAIQNDEPYTDVTERFIAAMYEDCDALGLLRPDHSPRATEYMPAIIGLIEMLEARGLAYRADNGDVYYRVARFEGYGQLSGRRADELRAGARVDVDEGKEDPLDFVLWKAAKPGEPQWESPWGAGRPGWHIECSAMATALLGNYFDIHGGGMDLKFPHHENEIAQSCGATGEGFVKLWMHNGFVQIDNEKMSKSLGNFFTVRDVLGHYYGDELHYFLLTAHYRSPLNYSDQELDAARAALTRLYTALRGLMAQAPPQEEPYTARFREAMDDDFNTPEALAVLFDLGREINRLRDAGDATGAAAHAALMRTLGAALGILGEDPEGWLKRPPSPASAAAMTDDEVDALIQRRVAARNARDFAEADRIRDELNAAGVALEDAAGTTTWRRS